MALIQWESDFVPYEAESRLRTGAVLVLAPHPDDEVIGCGGAIMQHIRQGDPVTVALLTDGAAAIPHENAAARLAYKANRLGESQAAAKVLGYSALYTWEAEDRGLSAWAELDQRLKAVVHEVEPQTLYTPSIYEVHPDHYALADAVCRLAPSLSAEIQLMFYEIGIPAPVNLLLDITRDSARKRDALRCFESQLEIQDYLRHMEALNVYRTYTLPATVRAAEGFLAVTAGELSADPLRCFGRSRLTEWLKLRSEAV